MFELKYRELPGTPVLTTGAHKQPMAGAVASAISKGALLVATPMLADVHPARWITGQVIDSEGGFRRWR